MIKQLIIELSIGLMMLGSVVSASALTIDTNAGWDGNINNGWLGSGQSLTVNAIENHFDSIGFYFDNDSLGRSFNFVLSNALNGGSTLFSTSFTVISGINIININQLVTSNSTVYALIDYNGFLDKTAHFSEINSYAGGQSVFGALGAMTDQYHSLDHQFIAEFSEGNGSAPVPEPGTMMLLGVGMAGLALYSKRRKNSKI